MQSLHVCFVSFRIYKNGTEQNQWLRFKQYQKTNYNLSSIIIEHRKITTSADENPDPGLGQAKQKWIS